MTQKGFSWTAGQERDCVVQDIGDFAAMTVLKPLLACLAAAWLAGERQINTLVVCALSRLLAGSVTLCVKVDLSVQMPVRYDSSPSVCRSSVQAVPATCFLAKQ